MGNEPSNSPKPSVYVNPPTSLHRDVSSASNWIKSSYKKPKPNKSPHPVDATQIRASLLLKNININNPEPHVISNKVATIAAEFWSSQIDSLPIDQKLEIGCAIYFHVMLANKELKKILKAKQKSIESLALKFLDMIGWLIRAILNSSSDTTVYVLLTQLGQFHNKMGINKMEYFAVMLESIHETMQCYFPMQYKVEVKYSMQQIFTVAAKVMAHSSSASAYDESTRAQSTLRNLDFLKSFESCLSCTVGREYLFHYLQQVCCDEVVVFYQLLYEFKSKTTNKERYMTAKKMVKTCIDAKNAPFSINIDCNIRKKIIRKMKQLEPNFVLSGDDDFVMSDDIFGDAEREMEQKIWTNHWTQFCKSLQSMSSKAN